MKKLRKVYFALLILTTFIFGGGLVLSSNKTTALAADAFAPAYMSAHKYKIEGGTPVKISTPIKNKDAVLLDSNQIFIFELGQQNLDTAQFAISTAILRISVNGVEISNKPEYLKTSTFNGTDSEFKYISVSLNPYLTENPDQTGKYEIFVRYMEHEKINGVFYNATERNVSFNFYLYKTSTYLTSNSQPAVLIENTTATVTEGSASVYNKTHYFNYTNNLSGVTSLSLPSITFNSNLFELEITKTYSGQNSQTKIYKDNSGNLVVTNNIVLVYKNENEISVAFNDIGAYTVKFIFIHRNADGTRDSLENLTTTIRPDLVNVFGFQLFHADINASTNNASKEFKVINADNKLERQYQTDITFAFHNKTLTPTSRGDKFVLQNLTSPAVNFNTKDLPQVPVTNQAPVTFKYNANIDPNESYYYKLSSHEDGVNLWTRHTNYNGSSFTEAGTYLVKVSYKSNLSLNNELKTQWFYFTISTKTPEFSVKVNGVNLSNQSFTKETVEVAFNEINSPFNSSVSLKVYTKQSLSAAYGNPVTIAEGSQSYFSANGIYKVVLAFGKNQSKDISTEFTIDTSPITGLTARKVQTNSNNKKVKAGAVDFFTNESVAIEWNNKTSNNNTITAAYKFIPITQLASSFTPSDYENFYNLRYIPIQYKLDYDPKINTTLSKIPYENTLYDQTLSETSILNQQGLYLVELKDKAGNVAYTYFVIDKTTPVILQRADGAFLTDYSKLNLVANDTEILWGQYKVIQTSLYETGVEFDTWLKEDGSAYLDEWLRLMLVQKASHQQLFNDRNADFKAITLGGTTKLFLASEINQQSVTVEVNGVKYEVGKLNTLPPTTLPQLTLADDGYSLEVLVVKNGTLYEGTYYFELSDESNTSMQSVATHMLGVSSDISQTTLKYGAKETLLTKHTYETVNVLESLKNAYYMPINTNIVTLQYLTTTNESTIEIGNITINYFPYITNYVIFTGSSSTLKFNEFYTLDEVVVYVGENASGLLKNNSYTIKQLIDSGKEEFSWGKFRAGTSPVLSKTATSTIVVYDYNGGINLGTLSSGAGQTLYNYNINPEMFTDGASLTEKTKAGKYQITRTYRTLSDTTTIVDSKNDFMTRTLTFILDRYSVITPPEQKNINPNPETAPENILKSLVGGEIYIEVLAGSGKQENIFNQVYKAISTSLETPILETNKLPVKIAIPVMKFGQVIANDFMFFANNLFYSSDVASYINSFEMQIEVKHIETNISKIANHSVKAYDYEPSGAYVKLTNGIYLSFTNVSNGYIVLPTFEEIGTYQVLISQKNRLSQGENVSQAFTFKIVNIPPTFEIKDANGYEITADENRIYYTNTNTLRVTWTDSANNFMAKIDKNNLVYTVNNTTQPKINPALVQTSSSGLIHYFDLDLSRYPENTRIEIFLTYENNTQNPNLTFTASKTIITDKTAPTSSINALIQNAKEPTVINAANLRIGHGAAVGYNKTVTTGIFKNFAFTVEKSVLQSILTSLTGTTVYAKRVSDKYNNLSYTELDPSLPSAVDTVKNSGEYNQITNFDALLVGEYYEIAELDLAGNLTVYTVYITNISQLIAAEQVLANQSPTYKQDLLGDDLKLLVFETANGLTSSTVLENSNAAYNIKLFAKDYFNLKNINMFGYGWFVITFNNNKYLASPYLANNMLYKLSASSSVEVNLTNEFKLALARSNYTLTFNNTSAGTITYQIATSSQQLTFVQPSPTSPSLTINRATANETEFINWQSVTIWEFKSKAISAFARFSPTSATPVEYSPEVAGFNLARYTTQTATTVFTLSASLGAYYRFKVIDNFGNEYVFYTLYGNEYVDKIATIDGTTLIQDKLETDEESFYISDLGFKFSFFHSITSATVKVSVFNPELKTWSMPFSPVTITETTNYNIPFNTSGYGYFERYSSYTTIYLNPTVQSPLFKGAYVRYEVTTSMTEELQEDIGQQTETYNFKVYNLLPSLALKGKNRQDLTALLTNNANLTSDPITIEFANTMTFEYPVKTYISRNGETAYEIESGQTFTEVGTYVITRVYLGKMSNFAIQTEQFTISNAKLDFFEVVQYSSVLGKYVTVDATGESYLVERPIQLEQTTITQHYIVNTTDFRINLNTSQMMEEISSQEVRKAGITTFVKTLSNKNASNASSTINYFETTIAITYIPQTNKIIKANSFYYLDSQGKENLLTNSEKVLTLLKETDNTETVTIFWNNYHEIVENKISVEIRYGQSNQLLTNAKIYTREGLNYTTLNRSGNYMFTFRDLAGNVHKFDYNSQIQNTSTSFNFVFISSVIFTVNGEPVIQHAVYNSDVEISVPNYTLPYYDSTGKPVIKVERNGASYSGYKSSSSQRTYTFTESGLYQITFSAKRDGKEVKETPYYFSIIRSNELTWAFSITEFSTYYIEKIKHNNTDVTRHLTSLGLGEITKIKENNVEVEYLKNIIFSLYDEQTGSGTWEITINTNNDLNQKFTYTFKIGGANIPISISQKQGESTTDTIKVMFNARNIYDSVGEVIVMIGRTTYELNQEYFGPGKPENIEFNITALGDTYIQILTPSGRLLYTYKVTRDEPLNTVAIIVIVVSSLVVAGLTVMFILLRKKMQIR